MHEAFPRARKKKATLPKRQDGFFYVWLITLGYGISNPPRLYALCFEEYLFLCLAHSWRQSRCRIADGDDDGRLFCIGHLEEFVTVLGVEVTNPAGAKPLLCCSEAKMLHGNGDIDVAVRLAICSHPFLFMQDRGEDIERRIVEPRALVAGLKLLPAFLAADDAELPRLPVHGRRSKTHTLLEVRDFLFLYRLRKVAATTVARADDV